VLFQAQAQVVDTSVADSLTQSGAFWAKDFRPNPKKATIYAAVFPGLGQIYNRKYWKLPIVYGGFLGLAYAISWNGKYYNNYKDAYISIMDTNEDTNAYLDMLPPNVDPNDPNLKSWLPSALQRSKDNYRRWRDMSIAGVAALYALSVIDAYVDAQMFDFDISPDLSMKVEPVVNTGYETASVGAKLQLNF
jgi:hypothetical protein